jgi:hypothetical protein
MARITKYAASLAAAALLFAGGAVAEENQHQIPPGTDLSVGQGVVCDTAQQVRRFSELLGESRNLEKSISTVNTEAENPRACGMVLAAFVRGDEVGEVRDGATTAKVVEITILAVPVNDQWHFVTPLKQYTAFKSKGVDI